jgi:tetratricopeptide (TPR) repeat protein
MERQGADIFFSGFSQMKRFPFFYDMSNWLVPFYIEHPDIRNYVETIGQNRLVEKLLARRAFCNSDKYSLVMVMRQVMGKLPEKLLEMLKQGEVDLDQLDDEEMSELKEQAASIRRGYLMDLYRFFQLFPNRSAMRNPFEAPQGQLSQSLFFGSALFAGTPIEQHKREVVSLLLKQKMNVWAERLLETFPKEMHDVQYYLWTEDYESALALDHTNERALVGFARSLFKRGRYQQAGRMYDILMRHHPGRRSYMLNKAVCLVHTAAYEEALALLYQLNYEHGDDDKVLRVLAWTLTCQGRLDQAERHYRQIASRDASMADDYLNQGYCLWLMGRTAEAADSFRKFLGMRDSQTDSPTLSFDKQWLQERGIDELDIRMMQAEIEK